jgi:hypothetical protein
MLYICKKTNRRSDIKQIFNEFNHGNLDKIMVQDNDRKILK